MPNINETLERLNVKAARERIKSLDDEVVRLAAYGSNEEWVCANHELIKAYVTTAKDALDEVERLQRQIADTGKMVEKLQRERDYAVVAADSHLENALEAMRNNDTLEKKAESNRQELHDCRHIKTILKCQQDRNKVLHKIIKRKDALIGELEQGRRKRSMIDDPPSDREPILLWFMDDDCPVIGAMVDGEIMVEESPFTMGYVSVGDKIPWGWMPLPEPPKGDAND